jgi:hypothetical protein
MGRPKKPTLASRLQAERMVEEQLRPSLPAHIPANSTWLQSAKDLMDTSPELYAGIVKRLADGDTVPAIQKLTRLPVELIRRIRDLHPEVVEAGIAAAHSRIVESLHNAATRLADNIDDIPLSSLPVSVGILTDKVQLIRGHATQRIERRNVATPEDIKAMFDSLPKAKAVQLEDTK